MSLTSACMPKEVVVIFKSIAIIFKSMLEKIKTTKF